MKLKYAHAGGYNPPIVVIHGNQVSRLPDSYKRHMMNYFRRSLKVVGTPIQLRFQEGDNPFENKTGDYRRAMESQRAQSLSKTEKPNSVFTRHI